MAPQRPAAKHRRGLGDTFSAGLGRNSTDRFQLVTGIELPSESGCPRALAGDLPPGSSRCGPDDGLGRQAMAIEQEIMFRRGAETVP